MLHALRVNMSYLGYLAQSQHATRKVNSLRVNMPYSRLSIAQGQHATRMVNSLRVNMPYSRSSIAQGQDATRMVNLLRVNMLYSCYLVQDQHATPK